jgi:hypothetical protein
MAPRGIVAASTASAFSATLVSKGVGGAADILPVTFVVIVSTVAVYGLTAEPVARHLDVSRPTRTRPLLVGGAPWVVELGKAFQNAGLNVLMWAGPPEQRAEIEQVGVELTPGELLADATGRGAELEGITAVLICTAEDDFNALASTTLEGKLDRPMYRVGPEPGSYGVVAPYTGGKVLFDPLLNGSASLRAWGANSDEVLQRFGPARSRLAVRRKRERSTRPGDTRRAHYSRGQRHPHPAWSRK